MATVSHELSPEAAVSAASAFPQYVKNDGSYFPVSGLAFDPAIVQAAYWRFRAIEYGSGNLTLDVEWYGDDASSGTIDLEASISAITPNTDTQDIETDTLQAVSSVVDTHLGTTGQRLHRATITITGLDSLAADDIVTIKIERDADDATNDTMSGAMILVLATLSYSDT